MLRELGCFEMLVMVIPAGPFVTAWWLTAVFLTARSGKRLLPACGSCR